jgi:hypothetical protein
MTGDLATLTDREVLVRTYTKVEGIEETLDGLSEAVYKEHEKRLRVLEQNASELRGTVKNSHYESRISGLERTDAKNEGERMKGKDNRALFFAIAACAISFIGLAISVVG